MVASRPESATDVTADGRTLLLIDWANTELERRELATGAESYPLR
jgi:hypothetical protein